MMRAGNTQTGPRMLVHPGTCNPQRVTSLQTERRRHLRLALSPGETLHSALAERLAEAGVHSASMTILGGWFDHLTYCVAPRDPAGRSVICYSDPIDAGPGHMIFGNATLGRSLTEQPMLHCHAALRLAGGTLRGGHILADRCVIGAHPISVLVAAIEGFELRQRHDVETNMPLMHPWAGGPADV